MEKYIQWIEYRNKKILFCNFANLKETEYLAGLDEMEKMLLSQPGGSKPLLLMDIANSFMTGKTKARGDEIIKKLTAAELYIPTAMIGMKGVKKIIAQAISHDIYFAKDKESAMEWLVTQ